MLFLSNISNNLIKWISTGISYETLLFASNDPTFLVSITLVPDWDTTKVTQGAFSFLQNFFKIFSVSWSSSKLLVDPFCSSVPISKRIFFLFFFETSLQNAYSSSNLSIDEAYKILGMPKGSSKEEIIKAANQLQKKIHPDLNPNSNTERLSQIVNEAKETVLKNIS